MRDPSILGPYSGPLIRSPCNEDQVCLELFLGPLFMEISM